VAAGCAPGSSSSVTVDLDAQASRADAGDAMGAGPVSKPDAGQAMDGAAHDAQGSTGDTAEGGAPDASMPTRFEPPLREAPPVNAKPQDCSDAPDMQFCEASSDGGSQSGFCALKQCKALGSGPGEFTPEAIYFPCDYPDQKLKRVDGDEPVIQAARGNLEFMGCLAGAHGNDCGEGSALNVTNAEAAAYCDQLSWASHDDWYLPDLGAMLSMVDIDMGKGIDHSMLRGTPASGALWTHNVVGDEGMYIGFNGGGPDDVWDATDPAFFVCMRLVGGTQPMPQPRFDVRQVGAAGETVAYDPITRVLWAVRDTPKSEFGEAAADCDTLVWAGFDDWRLPLKRESIVMGMRYVEDPELEWGYPREVFDGDQLWTPDQLEVFASGHVWALRGPIHHRCVRSYEPAP